MGGIFIWERTVLKLHNRVETHHPICFTFDPLMAGPVHSCGISTPQKAYRYLLTLVGSMILYLIMLIPGRACNPLSTFVGSIILYLITYGHQSTHTSNHHPSSLRTKPSYSNSFIHHSFAGSFVRSFIHLSVHLWIHSSSVIHSTNVSIPIYTLLIFTHRLVCLIDS